MRSPLHLLTVVYDDKDLLKDQKSTTDLADNATKPPTGKSK